MPALTPHYWDIATDPFRNFKYIVEFVNPPGGGGESWKMGFMSASGFSASHEVIPYREGGANTSVRKLPGQTNFSDITLTKGVTFGQNKLWKWFQHIFDVTNGNANSLPAGQHAFRAKELRIRMLDHPGDGSNVPQVADIRVVNAWPTNMAFSDLDAGGNAIFVQQLVITHEGWSFGTGTSRNTQTGNILGNTTDNGMYSPPVFA